MNYVWWGIRGQPVDELITAVLDPAGLVRDPRFHDDTWLDEDVILCLVLRSGWTVVVIPEGDEDELNAILTNYFKERGDGQIVNVSSMLGRIPFAVIRSAYNGAKHFLDALTANFMMEHAESHPGIIFTLVSPGVVRTDFGLNAMHGGPDSRQLPYSQSAEEVAEVIANVIDSRRNDVYTRAGSRDRVVEYYSTIGEDP